MRYPAAENNSAFIFLVNLRKYRIFGGQKQIIREVLPPPTWKRAGSTWEIDFG
jgi:hypothetical protein